MATAPCQVHTRPPYAHSLFQHYPLISQAWDLVHPSRIVCKRKHPLMQSFTPLEMDILECLASFWSIEDISEELEGSPKKIRSYIAGLRKKLSLPDTSDIRRSQQYDVLCASVRAMFHPVQHYALIAAEESDAYDC